MRREGTGVRQMHSRGHSRLLAVLLAAAVALAPAARAEPPAGLSPDEHKQVEQGVKDLQERVATLSTGKASPDDVADVDVFVKGVVWALRYETKLEPADVAQVKKALE